jgi:hypothetical protein
MANDRRHEKLKRRMHRKKKAEDKRKASAMPVALLLSDQGSPPLAGAKMSEALELMARPLLDSMPEGTGIQAIRAAVLLTAAGWNAAVTHAPEETEQALRELARQFTKDSPELGELTLHFLRELAERKRRLFPHDDRLVMEVEVEDRGDQFHITAVSMRWPHGSSHGSPG